MQHSELDDAKFLTSSLSSDTDYLSASSRHLSPTTKNKEQIETAHRGYNIVDNLRHSSQTIHNRPQDILGVTGAVHGTSKLLENISRSKDT